MKLPVSGSVTGLSAAVTPRRDVLRSALRRRAVVGGAVALLLGHAPLGAQVQWAEAPHPGIPGLMGAAAAYDSNRGEVIAFGGENNFLTESRTWAWNGSAWSERVSVTRPEARMWHAMAYDAGRDRVVLFGGTLVRTTGPARGDTWEWDGSSWRQRTQVGGPSPRLGPAMVYDAGRGVVVLFGGRAFTGVDSGDTWEFDGHEWRQRFPATAPPARHLARMVYDAGRGRVLMFGGKGPPVLPGSALTGTSVQDMWEWDGTTWRELMPATRPPARHGHGMAIDPASGGVLVFGGYTSVGQSRVPRGDTWFWDGVSWTQDTSPAPLPRSDVLLAPDRVGRLVLHGGENLFDVVYGDTWTWDASGWAVALHGSRPDPRQGHAMAYDAARGETVLFGGRPTSQTTWLWNGGRWRNMTPTPSPSARGSLAMAYDEQRQRVVLFGGQQGTVFLRDTWEWDGSVWTLRSPARSPQARRRHAMAYDAARQRVVLFGGLGSTELRDTWEWDGTDWLRRFAATNPPARMNHTMFYDRSRRRVLLHGGGFRAIVRHDTWEWDGTDWTRLATGFPRRFAGIAYDTARSRAVLYGGQASAALGSPSLSETWEWDGAAWSQRQPQSGLGERTHPEMVYDERRRVTVLFGAGRGAANPPTAVFEYGPTDPASWQAFGSGCGGVGGVPTLSPVAGQLPWLGDVMTLEMANTVAGNPALLLLGVSKTSWAGLALPVSLAFAGLPACQLHVSLDAVSSGVSVAGVARFELPVPITPAALGLELHAQGVAADATAPGGLAMSPAGTLRIGGR